MKLFLASEAKHPESLQKLEVYVGGLAGKTLAYIPTAANGDGFPSWKTGGSWKRVQELGMKIELVELEKHDSGEIFQKLNGKDIIWLAGGWAGYLMYWIRRREVGKMLPKLLDQGSIYVGSSAGSMITAPSLDVASWYIGEEEPGTKGLRGLGLVDFDFYPHFEDEMMTEIQQKYTGKKLYVLKNGEAITIQGGEVSVLGKERIVTGDSIDAV